MISTSRSLILKIINRKIFYHQHVQVFFFLVKDRSLRLSKVRRRGRRVTQNLQHKRSKKIVRNEHWLMQRQTEDFELASSSSSVKASFWMLHVSACVLLNSATALVTVDFTGDGSRMKRASRVTWPGSQLQRLMQVWNNGTINRADASVNKEINCPRCSLLSLSR
jgi:hypothetical protein